MSDPDVDYLRIQRGQRIRIRNPDLDVDLDRRKSFRSVKWRNFMFEEPEHPLYGLKKMVFAKKIFLIAIFSLFFIIKNLCQAQPEDRGWEEAPDGSVQRGQAHQAH